MSETPVAKPWWQSRTVWSGIVSILGSLGALFGFVVPQDIALSAVMGLVTLMAGVGAITGRVQATQPIDKKLKPTAGAQGPAHEK